MKIIGKTTINPILFYTGKICGYILWVLLGLHLLNISLIDGIKFYAMEPISYTLLFIGLSMTILSLINLGKSTTLGLPLENTEFKSDGLYRFSRNPMYVGFNLITLASMIYNISIIKIILGIYSILIYHLIILGEEKYLGKTFGTVYLEYKKKVRRYI